MLYMHTWYDLVQMAFHIYGFPPQNQLTQSNHEKNQEVWETFPRKTRKVCWPPIEAWPLTKINIEKSYKIKSG